MTGPVRPDIHGRRADQTITAACFPVPALLLRTNTPAAQSTVRAFAGQQAEAACTLAQKLSTALRLAPDMSARVSAFTTAFEAAEEWRHAVAVASPHSAGRYSSRWADRFQTPVTDEDPNLFRIGDHARYREGSTWDPATRTYQGGAETPASRTMRHYEALAAARFPQQSNVDIVCNTAPLPSGSVAGGMRLLRGDAARRAAIEMARRIAARGGDTSRITTNGPLIYAASAPESDGRVIFHQAMTLLAQEHATPADAQAAWVRAAYLLYQAPRKKRGADATIRTFLIAAGARLQPQPPVLPHDIDLRAYTQTHDHFANRMLAFQNSTETATGRRT